MSFGEIPIAGIVIGDRVRKELGDITALATSIWSRGLFHPIGVTPDGHLIFGERRLRACRDVLGWTKIPAQVIDIEDVAFGEHDENELHKAFTVSERVAIGRAVERAIGNRQGQRTDIEPVQNLAQVPVGEKTRTEAAQRAGFGNHETYRQAKQLVDRGAPVLVEAVDKGKASVSAAAEVAELPKPEQEVIVARGEREIVAAAKLIREQKAAARREERIEKLETISRGNAPLLAPTLYPVLMADPPWRYEGSKVDAWSVEEHYPTMTLADISALNVADLATPDAVLFLWATSPKLADALTVLSAWGFSYRTCAVWDKQWPGMGYWFRQRHELLLVAVRGNMPAPTADARPESIFVERRGEHSRKPEIAYQIIEQMFPTLPRLELFAREARRNWSAWGNQVAREGMAV